MHFVLQTFLNYMRYLTSFTVKFSENISSDKKEEKNNLYGERKKNILKLTLLSQLMAMLSFPQASFMYKM